MSRNTKASTTLASGMEGVGAIKTPESPESTAQPGDSLGGKPTSGPNVDARPKPSIGRIVQYRITEAQAAYADAQAGRKNVLKAGKIVPAIVMDVHSDTMVDLRIFISAGDAFVTSVALGTIDGTWQWPERV